MDRQSGKKGDGNEYRYEYRQAFRRSVSDGYCQLLAHGRTAEISSWIRQYIRYPREYFK